MDEDLEDEEADKGDQDYEEEDDVDSSSAYGRYNPHPRSLFPLLNAVTAFSIEHGEQIERSPIKWPPHGHHNVENIWKGSKLPVREADFTVEKEEI